MNLDKCQICSFNYAKHFSVIPYIHSEFQKGDSAQNLKCHLVCASFIKDVEIKIRNKQKSKIKMGKKELIAETSVNLKGLEYSQLLCQICNEIDTETYTKCAVEDCNNYFHISCIIQNQFKISLGRWSDIYQQTYLLEPICSEHINNKKYIDKSVSWLNVDKQLKQKIFDMNNIDIHLLSDDELLANDLKNIQQQAVGRKESHSQSQEDSQLTKFESKSERKSQRKRNLKIKQIDENTTISNSAVDSAESSDVGTQLSSQQQQQSYQQDQIKSTLKRKLKSENTKQQSKQIEQKGKDEQKKCGRKKKVNKTAERETKNGQLEKETMTTIEKVFKNNTLFKDCLDPTKSKVTEEVIKKNKVKISGGIPQYPNTNDSNRQNLMKQWWKYVNDFYFKECSQKDFSALTQEKMSSLLDLEDQDDNMPQSRNYRYEKFIFKSQYYQTLIENDYYLNGVVPSLKNHQYLTVLYENDCLNFLVKYEVIEQNLKNKILEQLKTNQKNQINNLNLNIISQSQINDLAEIKPKNCSINSTTFNSSSIDLQDVLSLNDIQGVDIQSLQKSIECTKYVLNSQNESNQQLNKLKKSLTAEQEEDNLNNQLKKIKNKEQEEILDEENTRLPNQIEYEIMYYQEQLKSLLDENNQEKRRILDNIHNEYNKYLQIEDLEKESRKVYDIVKWNTIIRYMKVGYGEKNEEILLTYIKNENLEDIRDQKKEICEEFDSILDKAEDKNTNQGMFHAKGGKNTWRSKIFQQLCLRNTDGYIEIDCKICFNNYSSEANPVVYCSLCSASFHQFCYGIKEIPHDDFLCDLCLFRQSQAQKENNSKQISNFNSQVEIQSQQKKKKKREHRLLCKICMKTGFPMIDVSHQFYHVSCLIFLNLIYIKDSCISLRGGESDEDIIKFQDNLLDTVVKNEFSCSMCAICQKRQGYKIKCNHCDCSLSFHTHCAYIEGLYFDIEILQPKQQNKNLNENSQENNTIKSYTSLDECSIDENFNKIKTSIFCPNHQPVKDRDEILQIYLRRYGINLYQTAVEYKDYNSFISDHENIQKESKQKIEDIKLKIHQDNKVSYEEIEGMFKLLTESCSNQEIDIADIFGDLNENNQSLLNQNGGNSEIQTQKSIQQVANNIQHILSNNKQKKISNNTFLNTNKSTSDQDYINSKLKQQQQKENDKQIINTNLQKSIHQKEGKDHNQNILQNNSFLKQKLKEQSQISNKNKLNFQNNNYQNNFSSSQFKSINPSYNYSKNSQNSSNQQQDLQNDVKKLISEIFSD